MKACNKCEKVQPESLFRTDKRNKDGRQGICRICQRKYQGEFNKEWNASPKAKAIKRDHRLVEFWPGATFAEANANYNALFSGQRGCCGICGTHQGTLNQALSVDHCHKSGKVRGLLCGNCNRGLGHFRDRPSRLRLAALYLEGAD